LGVKTIRKVLASLVICIVLMLTLSGVSAEEISADSSAGNGDSGSVEPTYTLVYAILGILFVCVLFYTGHIQNND
jgi:hypothetical protein